MKCISDVGIVRLLQKRMKSLDLFKAQLFVFQSKKK